MTGAFSTPYSRPVVNGRVKILEEISEFLWVDDLEASQTGKW